MYTFVFIVTGLVLVEEDAEHVFTIISRYCENVNSWKSLSNETMILSYIVNTMAANDQVPLLLKWFKIR